MRYKRHYIQFNDLVFDEYDMVGENDSSTSFKVSDSEYSFGNGSYSPMKAERNYVAAGSVSFTLTLRMNKLACDERKYYRRFAVSELSKNGRLWAVQDNTLIWAWGRVTSLSEGGGTDRVELDLDISLPEGVWHKADKLRTFLVPYNRCEFMDCYGYKDLDPCDCCSPKVESPQDCCCDCPTKEMALCYHKDLQDLYDCDLKYKVVYDCLSGEDYFGFENGVHIGQKLCTEYNGSLISGQFYSDTDIDTDVKITLIGTFSDPYIEVNGNGNFIEGDFTGQLSINPNGEVYYLDENGCEEELLDVSAWKIPSDMTYGWTVHPGNNSLLIETHNCCGFVCAFVEDDPLTI